MERTATSTLSRCLQSGKTLRCQFTAPASRRCIAATIQPYSSTAARCNSTIAQRPIPTPASLRHFQPLSSRSLHNPRIYSTTSSPLGSIGEGEAGISTSTTIPATALSAPSHLNEQEKEIWELLHKELEPTELDVQDISGGCGSMYGIEIVSSKFTGLNMLKQQRLVNSVLGERVKGWHGVQLRTRST